MLHIQAGELDEAEAYRARSWELEQALDPDAIELQALQGFLVAHGTDRFAVADEDALRLCATRYPGRPIWCGDAGAPAGRPRARGRGPGRVRALRADRLRADPADP